MVAAGGIVVLWGAPSVAEGVFVGLWVVACAIGLAGRGLASSGLLPPASGTSSAVPLAAQGILVGTVLGAGAVLAAIHGAGHQSVEATWWSWWIVLVYASGPVLVMPDALRSAAGIVMRARRRSP